MAQPLALNNPDAPKFVNHLRRTLRSVSMSTSSVRCDDVSEQPRIRKNEGQSRSRRISQGVKSKLKRLFGSPIARGFPLQQVKAKRQHYADDEAWHQILNPIIPTPSPELVARMNSRPPSESFSRPPSMDASQPPALYRQDSCEPPSTRSRVTSWASSEASKDAFQRETSVPPATERSRLSIIQESPLRLRRVSALPLNQQQSPGFAAFKHPRRGGLCDPVETAQLLSELQRELQMRSPPRVDNISDDSDVDQAEWGTAPTHRSRQPYGHSTARSPDRGTIRMVRSNLSGMPSVTRRDSSLKCGQIKVQATPSDDVFESSPLRALQQRHSRIPLHHKMSLQDLNRLNEESAASAKKSLRETRSTFFPGRRQYPEHRSSPWQSVGKSGAELNARTVSRSCPTVRDNSDREESPMTPFTKFMASDTSPLAGYELRERSTSKSNAARDPERKPRLRRIEGSILPNPKHRPAGPKHSTGFQRYRESYFVEQLSPFSGRRDHRPLQFGHQSSDDKENIVGSQEDDDDYGSDDMERFPDVHSSANRTLSGAPAFV